jgi:hypothetical protein
LYSATLLFATSFDERPKLIGESQSIGCTQPFNGGSRVGAERIRWRRIVVRQLHASRHLAHALHDVRGDP